MDSGDASAWIFLAIRRYRVHILVFFIVLFVGLTFAHPELLMNDEWITVNQLHQLHDGHQVLVNEGKYGFFENGTMNAYFAARSNVLGYSLFLPLLSLPSHWFIDILGDHFVFFILYLWTFVLLAVILSLHFIFREYSFIGRWRWTPAATGAVFIIFFINLFYYIPFRVHGPGSYPEALAVAFTNILLLALAGVLIYEINRALFDDPGFSLFGTIVCLLSSSYFFWATGCKDHILTMLLFVAVLFCMVKFRKTDDSWYLPLAFLITGLLAWARPELALWVFFFVCGIWGYSCVKKVQRKSGTGYIVLICMPLFTVFGALPFFLNNYLITKNPLLPPNALYLSGESAGLAVQGSPYLPQTGGISSASFTQIFSMKNTVPSSNIPWDIFGILFHPHNGSMGVFCLTPLFLVMAVLAVVLVQSGKLQFSREELNAMAIIAFLAIPVFFAYANNLPQLNTSQGITPDMRYLSPVYVPLTLLGLIIMRKLEVIAENPVNILKKILIISAVGIPLSLYLTATVYTDPKVAAQLDAPLSDAFSLCIFFLAALTLFFLAWNFFSKHRNAISGILIASLCGVPFIWQITISIRFWGFAATSQGYPPWIPIIRILNTLLSSPLLAH